MIDYGNFQLACPPFTGSTWCIKAAAEAGLMAASKNELHIHFTGEHTKLRVSTVRHPVDWLRSYWKNGGSISVPAVDRILPYRQRSNTFYEFVISLYKDFSSPVSAVMFSYKADTYIRTDELNEGFTEILESVGAPMPYKASSLSAQNQTKELPNISDSLRGRIVEQESEYVKFFAF